ncbi:hypothetical protein CVIRNUC_010678 [Coccomyxa viridis]|uniref:Potassium transporter n=1 Tax=Coccomyxa viridis TaxID=1274662 RepID=A0AAV1IJE7_9CHLO|nr:hypothetical protein CVIRNUC_010678 [Coccomyxa viridis]
MPPLHRSNTDGPRRHVLPKKASFKSKGSILSHVTSGTWEEDADIENPHDAEEARKSPRERWLGLLLLSFQTIGVVYGDIGTSPLYVVQSTFNIGSGADPSEEDILGVISLIIWTLTALLVFKYCLIVLRADDNGQGGAFALFSLLKRQAELGKKSKLLSSERSLSQYTIGRGSTRLTERLTSRKRASTAPSGALSPLAEEPPAKLNDWRQRFVEGRFLQIVIRTLCVLGVGMIMGDGVLTPAISVVSAIEGLGNIPGGGGNIPRKYIVIIAIVIIILLFMAQQFGTGVVGSAFSPVILIWFIFNTVIGLYNIITYRPDIFKAFGPNYWFAFFLRNGRGGWDKLGGVVLCVTGTEALFADMGHFNRPSIQLSTLALVYPALMITYLGQGSYLLAKPSSWSAMFWNSLPGPVFWPMFVVATLAAIIASQAMISAVFQIVKQAIVQGFFPRFHVYHTSRKHAGQVYIPFMNYLLMALCLIITGAFQTSDNIGRAYGLAVLADMLITTHFMTLVMLTIWRLPLVLVVAFYFVFTPIEATYWSSTLEKVPTGGWFSIMMSVIYASIMLLWFWGTSKRKAFYARKNIKLTNFLALMDAGDGKGKDHQNSMTIAQQNIALRASSTKLKRVRGVGLYYGEEIHGVPPVLLQMVSRTPVLYEVNIFVTNRFVPIPEVMEAERLLVEQLGVSGFYHVIARYGYMERVRQDESFVRELLSRVLHLLYKTLQERASKMPSLVKDLGLPTGSEIPPTHDPSFTDAFAKSPEGGASENGHSSPAGNNGDVQLTVREMLDVPSDSRAVDLPAQDRDAFADAGVLEQRRSVQPGDRAPPQPLVRTLEEVAEKLGTAPADIQAKYHRASIVADEIRIVKHAAAQHNVVFVLGHAHAVLPKDTKIWQLPRRLILEMPYKMMADFFQETADSVFGVPSAHLLEIGLPYTLQHI